MCASQRHIKRLLAFSTISDVGMLPVRRRVTGRQRTRGCGDIRDLDTASPRRRCSCSPECCCTGLEAWTSLTCRAVHGSCGSSAHCSRSPDSYFAALPVATTFFGEYIARRGGPRGALASGCRCVFVFASAPPQGRFSGSQAVYFSARARRPPRIEGTPSRARGEEGRGARRRATDPAADGDGAGAPAPRGVALVGRDPRYGPGY